MEVLHSIRQRVTLLVLVVTFLPLPARVRRRDTLLPDGVCGNRETMLEATQVGNAMLQQALAAGMPGVISP